MIETLFFYLFASITCLAGLMVISSRNPVHSVLFLILAFFNAAGLFVLLGAEFLAMLLVVVYVGAVAVLFLFVVMMLDINFVELREGFQRYMPLGLGVGGVLLAEILFVFFNSADMPETVVMVNEVSNTRALGRILYTDYIYLFQLAGLILLVAMIGAIALTLRKRENVRRQSIASQTERTRADSIEVVSVPSNTGVKRS
ncbi:MAG: NADH:ubiquinone oxidoreductase subunit J [SAR116 cluster bacterium]|jgi:NADH-quinone oxidoreductase subunit J|nr:NADH:ubiquinone oxidoreductase subunit J [SAR116 cluster bacterium]MBL6768826.1 NADH-quinone oxidoreductase subunit J [Alphaproteobacteria bacterium]MCH1428235.1 NADH-quinone oxidoreductase subunit J [Alphaproteobacteria bacterium]RCL79892.1 MAG: NADH-quinone oxidoreductase subunit J [SAR116 cluster bacterium]|tara:strand:+ start:527 stop:1126 length:600 start_codon:yes stop_codon:yes gene_type:complete